MKITKGGQKNLMEDLQRITEAATPAELAAEAPSGKITADNTEETKVSVTVDPETGKGATEEDTLAIKNTLTDILDDALATAFRMRRRGWHYNTNILINGLPGSSKTKTIENWARKNNLNLFYFDVKGDEVTTLVSGASAIDRTEEGKVDNPNYRIKQAYSSALDKLDRPNSILFLDELNRQLLAGVRGSLLTLIADKKIAGTDENGFKTFNSLLFTVAAINPKLGYDSSVTELTDAEVRRFHYHVIFDSTVESALEFNTKFWENEIKKLYKRKDTDPEWYKEDIGVFARAYLLGDYVITHPDLKFTTRDDLLAMDFKDTPGIDVTGLSQAVLTEFIMQSEGSRDRMIREIKTSGLNKKTKQDLIKILEAYDEPTEEEALKKVGTKLNLDLGAGIEQKKEVDISGDTTDIENELDKDDEFDFSGADDDPELEAERQQAQANVTANAGQKISSSEAEKKINDVLARFK